VNGLREAVSFLTPAGRATTPTPAALLWFPAIGAGLGGAVGVVWWGSAKAWPLGVAALFALGADLAVTGLLHFDGLVDSADGLLAPMDRARRLEVMADPRVGAFGLAAGGFCLLARWAAMASTRPAVLLVVGLWCASRTVMALIVLTVPYARAGEGGIASVFLDAPRWFSWVTGGVGLGIALAALVAWRPLGGPVALAAAFACAAGLVWLADRRLGGFTGDVVGAAGTVLETVGLMVAAARW
jgi:adenosylcobinamide-GDP ribazoletransferase